MLECEVRERDINLALWCKISHKRPGIDYDETSLVLDATTLHYLVSLVVSEELTMQLMDVVITYLYRDLVMKVYPIQVAPDQGAHLLRLQRSLYGLNQSRRKWYTCLSDYLIGRGYVNIKLCPLRVESTSSGFVII